MLKNNRLEWFITLVLLLGIAYGSYTFSKKISIKPVESEQVRVQEIEVVLDAGHGGVDPGKIGLGNILEKDINLEITYKIKTYLEEEGIRVFLTRETDERVDAYGEPYSKSEDMRTRVEMINEWRPNIVVSIHQNSYPSEEIRGAQVFYYTHSEKGREMAMIMQEEIRAIDVTNKRQIKADDTYYMLKYTEVPTIIVECGFLTNPDEAKKLADDIYQEKIAKAVTEGIKKCLEI